MPITTKTQNAPQNPADFIRWLDHLLAERKELRALFQDYYRYRLLADGTAMERTGECMSALVLGAIRFGNRYTASSNILAMAILELPGRFSSQSDPRRAWDYALPTGIRVDYPEPLRERLIDLLGPLDYVVARRRAT